MWFEFVKRLALIDVINFSMTSKKFYQIVWKNKKYKKVMWLSKFLVNFDEDYFEFIENNLKLLTKKIQTKFKEKIIKNIFVFNRIDLKVQKIIYQLLPFRIFCHLFFCRKDSKTAGKCLICTRIFVDNHDISVMFAEHFVLKKKSISHLPISRLMETVKLKSVSLNVYHMVGDFLKKAEE